jgi:hypothetical protein
MARVKSVETRVVWSTSLGDDTVCVWQATERDAAYASGFEVDDTAEWRAYQCADNYLLSHQLTTAEKRHALTQPEPPLGVRSLPFGAATALLLSL